MFFSPESISTALAIAYAGARTDTAAEMAKTLHFTLPARQLHPAMGAMLRDRNASHGGYQLKEADALWVQKDYPLQRDFQELTKDNYQGDLNQIDFSGEPDASRQAINGWIEQRTENKIRELLAPGSLTSNERMVLTNAIYFKGKWENKFQEEDTHEEGFRISAGRSIKTPMMHIARKFDYFDGNSFQALAIPFRTHSGWFEALWIPRQTRDFSMIVLLPKTIEGLSAFEQSLTPTNMQQWLAQLRPAWQDVFVTLPKFKMEAQFSLKDALTAMGMKEAFDEKMADFSGVASRETMQHDGNLYLGAVKHKAYIDVNEEGTEAAAATAVEMPGLSMPIVFRADHPFMFLIRDNRSGSILFMGRVTNPLGGATGEGTTFQATPPAATTTKLTSRPNPSFYGQEVFYEATVTSSIGVPPDGETISFMNGTTILGTGTLSDGLATFDPTETLKVGTTSITAVYAGDSAFMPSKSKPLMQRVTP